MDNICCLCENDIGEWGNNPYPLSDSGECCYKCNRDKVIPARLALIIELPNKQKGGDTG